MLQSLLPRRKDRRRRFVFVWLWYSKPVPAPGRWLLLQENNQDRQSLLHRDISAPHKSAASVVRPAKSCRTVFSSAKRAALAIAGRGTIASIRSEEHTSELQSRLHLVCRL